MTPRFAKRDEPATEKAHFKCRRSFVALDGTLRLYKQDWYDQVARVLERDSFKCRNCGRTGLDADHIKPRGKGGSDDLSNLRTLCRGCHESRHPEKQIKWTKKS